MKYSPCHIKKTLCLLAVFCSFQAVAQTQTEKAAIYMGPFDVTPEIDVVSETDDNASSAPSGTEIKEDVFLVRPSFSAVADDGVVRYTVEYELENGTSSNANSDYTDQTLTAQMRWSVDIRHLIEFNASIDDGHQERAADNVSAAAEELNQFTNQRLGVNYTFGSDGATGRIVIGYQDSSLRYDTNLDTTDVLETDTSVANAELSIALSPVTRFILQVEQTENTFLVDSLSNRRDNRYLVGFAWELTGLLTGDVRLGETTNDLVNVPGNATTSATGNVSIEWKPNTLSTWTFSANQNTQNSENNVGTFTNTLEYTLGWDYQWRDNITSTFSLTKVEDEFVGASREDDTNRLSLGVNYAMRRWLSFGLTYQYEERDSVDNNFDFDKNVFNLSVNASL